MGRAQCGLPPPGPRGAGTARTGRRAAVRICRKRSPAPPRPHGRVERAAGNESALRRGTTRVAPFGPARRLGSRETEKVSPGPGEEVPGGVTRSPLPVSGSGGPVSRRRAAPRPFCARRTVLRWSRTEKGKKMESSDPGRKRDPGLGTGTAVPGSEIAIRFNSSSCLSREPADTAGRRSQTPVIRRRGARRALAPLDRPASAPRRLPSPPCTAGLCA